jgi:hypothetical protein
MVQAGVELQRTADARSMSTSVRDLATGWARTARSRAVSPDPSSGTHGFLTPPPGRSGYKEREDRNAEPLIRDDVAILTAARR